MAETILQGRFTAKGGYVACYRVTHSEWGFTVLVCFPSTEVARTYAALRREDDDSIYQGEGASTCALLAPLVREVVGGSKQAIRWFEELVVEGKSMFAEMDVCPGDGRVDEILQVLDLGQVMAITGLDSEIMPWDGIGLMEEENSPAVIAKRMVDDLFRSIRGPLLGLWTAANNQFFVGGHKRVLRSKGTPERLQEGPEAKRKREEALLVALCELNKAAATA